MVRLTIKSQGKNYRVFFQKGWGFLEALQQKSGVWIIDRNVYIHYQRHFTGINKDSLILFAASEEQKTITGAIDLYRALLAREMKRSMPIISVGGGITQDVTGFVASTLYRGLHWLYVPTTLLAQADSCIGSKTSLNFDSAKNLIGTFYAPNEVFISTEFLDSLSPKDWYSGFGEIVKLQLMTVRQVSDLSAVAERLDIHKHPPALSNIIYDSLLIKKQYIEDDEFDRERRRLLNYGHCFGHALESASKFAIPHGLAVVAGMLFANIIARRRRRLSSETLDILIKKIFLPHLHSELLSINKEWFSPALLFQNMKKDKKRTGQGIALILPRKDLQLEEVQDLSRQEIGYGCTELKRVINV